MQLKIENLSKTYPNGTQALKNVSLTINNGLFGLLGPNGAGKSSLMRTIATLQTADTGSIWLDDLDVLAQPETMRKHLGYLPQEFGVYPNTPADELLHHLAILKGITNVTQRKAQIDSLLEQTNLAQYRKKAVGGYSGGMKQRFGIAQALLGNPKVIIVDEPTAGLDPAERNRFLNLLSEISEQVIIIFSTHIVEDVKELCNSMAIINQGNVILDQNPRTAVAALEGKVFSRIIAKTELADYRKNYTVVSNKLNAGAVEIHAISDTPLDGFVAVAPDLEDVYFSLVPQTA